MIFSVREMEIMDVQFVVDYFFNATPEYLEGMGADSTKLPNRVEWESRLCKELSVSVKEREFFYVIWLIDGKAVGHSNVNNIVFGETAKMHLHLWKNDVRRKGIGVSLLRKTLPFYFENFDLKKLICEPYALNEAPNRVLPKIGFEFVKNYMSTPGYINFYQSVSSYEMTRERFDKIFNEHSGV